MERYSIRALESRGAPNRPCLDERDRRRSRRFSHSRGVNLFGGQDPARTCEAETQRMEIGPGAAVYPDSRQVSGLYSAIFLQVRRSTGVFGHTATLSGFSAKRE